MYSKFLLILFIVIYNLLMIEKKMSLREQFPIMSSLFIKDNDVKYLTQHLLYFYDFSFFFSFFRMKISRL